ncbi:mitochondrial genome maintenance MGM101-domain-containing protein [Aspergillus heterothallicus]
MAFLRSLKAAEPLLQSSPIHRTATSPIFHLIRATGTRYFAQPTSTRTQNNTAPKPASPQTPPKHATPYSSPSSSSSASSAASSTAKNHPTTPNISKTGLDDKPLELDNPTADKIDWTRSFHGLSAEPFPREISDILLAETDPEEVEIKPDGILYLPEIKYRRILNKAFGPGGWGLAPRSESIVTPKTVTREYALVCHGRLVSVARGEQDYFSPDGIPTATEGCRSNALVRCCKDLGIASELWDPRWIRKYKAQYTREVWVEHVISKKKSKIWTRKDDSVPYPWKETK